MAPSQSSLTAAQQARLAAHARAEGIPIAEAVHEAIEAYLAGSTAATQAALDATFGVAPDFQIPSRGEWTS